MTKKTEHVDAYWDDLYLDDGIPDWDGPTHNRRLPNGRARIAPWQPQCRHWREPVDLLDGVTVFASAWFDRPQGHVDMDWPDVGLYLDGSWTQVTMLCSPGFKPRFARYRPAKVIVYPWPDLGVPREPVRFMRAVKWILQQAEQGKRVEIGCAGGHGRTGTTLATMLVLQGMIPARAAQKIRRAYCHEAIETRAQMQIIHSAR